MLTHGAFHVSISSPFINPIGPSLMSKLVELCIRQKLKGQVENYHWSTEIMKRHQFPKTVYSSLQCQRYTDSKHLKFYLEIEGHTLLDRLPLSLESHRKGHDSGVNDCVGEVEDGARKRRATIEARLGSISHRVLSLSLQ